ncbi:HAD family hydrolase [Arthrobacter sp. GMC3]|uniref:HAD family hydrolase n=1 Tax=Arthrobacter sp. GMC3 TaxID=2058894 RepID=UPI002157B07C|nr:HAD family hydrolase [Arthrobacter sp. GMC3]
MRLTSAPGRPDSEAAWLTLADSTKKALKNAKQQGWKIAIVANGTMTQQNLKIQKVGLDPYVDAVVTSEAVGVKKPDPKIFHIAAQRLHSEVTGGWMVGDHPTADISGGQAAGLETIWVSRGMKWPAEVRFPTLIAPTAAEVINAVVRRGTLAS